MRFYAANSRKLFAPWTRLGGLRQPEIFWSAHGVVLFGYREAGMRKGVMDEPVRVEIHLPVVLVIAVWTDGKHGARKVEGQDFDVGLGRDHHVWNPLQRRFQQRDRGVRVNSV